MQDFLKPAVWLGVALLVAYWAWLYLFFARVRPWLMRRLAQRLAVDVAESHEILDAGTYNITGRRAPARKHAAVWLADAALTGAGTVGMAALLFVPAFLVAESGALLPLEAQLTGRGATLEVPRDVEWKLGAHAASASAIAANTGAVALAPCEVRTAEYNARHGYINGKSRSFDLAPGASQRVELPLSAIRPPSAGLSIPLRLDCANERYGAARLRIVVR